MRVARNPEMSNLANLLAEEDGGGEEEHACVEVSGFGLRASGFEFRFSGFGLRVSGLGLRVSSFGFRGWVSRFGMRV